MIYKYQIKSDTSTLKYTVDVIFFNLGRIRNGPLIHTTLITAHSDEDAVMANAKASTIRNMLGDHRDLVKNAASSKGFVKGVEPVPHSTLLSSDDLVIPHWVGESTP
jgi:hypothetical protein